LEFAGSILTLNSTFGSIISVHTKTAEFTLLFDHNCRIRHFHRLSKNKIIEFCLQLEIYFEDKWYPIIRYDTAHGFTHKDILHKDGRIDKEPLFVNDYNEALTFAETDIKANWQIYRDQFLKEEDPNG
jgi:hypothetical protein